VSDALSAGILNFDKYLKGGNESLRISQAQLNKSSSKQLNQQPSSESDIGLTKKKSRQAIVESDQDMNIIEIDKN